MILDSVISVAFTKFPTIFLRLFLRLDIGIMALRVLRLSIMALNIMIPSIIMPSIISIMTLYIVRFGI
jgi:hypothetical protein